MRLDKLTIGSAKDSPKHQFKNLKNVTINFDQDHWVTVVIGWNGTGKSNVLEALAIIFRDLISKKDLVKNRYRLEFAFQLAYRMGMGDAVRHIHIDSDPDREKDPLIIHIATDAQARGLDTLLPISPEDDAVSAFRGKILKPSDFWAEESLNLPRYVFSYYSGESTRMHDVLLPYLKDYYQELLSGKDPGLKRLFYALPAHSQFVLLAFLIRPDKKVKDFFEKHLGIDVESGIESVLFVLREPPWDSKSGDERFWYARGKVQQFLDRLMSVAIAPIEISRSIPKSIWNKTKSKKEFKYLYIKDMEALRELVGEQESNEFFRDLESTYVSEIIEEVRIRVKLKKNDGSVTFRELSEGEQQLLTVLGLLRFTAENESLFLLDEPDTHLNPRWSVDYISYLKSFVTNDKQPEKNSHILLTTHNPLAVADLERKQVQILRLVEDENHRHIIACHPETDPRGTGYAAIVTSDMFGIASTLDYSTQLLLETQRALAARQTLTDLEQYDLDELNEKLDRLGFRFFHPDDEYSRYLRLRNKRLVEIFNVENPIDLAKKVIEMPREEREALAQKMIAELLEEDASDRLESSQ
jgi:ABC-type transport system involved in cytochrome c biogenesis ATPase subunit